MKDGLNLLKADLSFIEIRFVSPEYSNATIKAPSQPKAKPKVNHGNVQTSPDILIQQALMNPKLDAPGSTTNLDTLEGFGAILHDKKVLTDAQVNFIKSLIPKK
jgi:hypothetical protein